MARLGNMPGTLDPQHVDQANDPADFMPIAEAAERLGISRASAIRRVRAGRLGGYRDPDSGYYYAHRAAVAATLRRLQALRAAAKLPGGEPLDDRYRAPAEESR
jgi:DNA-binding MurR/RpiR family transcriptional regulator